MNERRAEIGLARAIGATPRQVLRLFRAAALDPVEALRAE